MGPQDACVVPLLIQQTHGVFGGNRKRTANGRLWLVCRLCETAQARAKTHVNSGGLLRRVEYPSPRLSVRAGRKALPEIRITLETARSAVREWHGTCSCAVRDESH